ncbi:SRPBCC family protein [Planotetraspora kaengkrachanensis]|uniref:Coenzyme Q-binding protein COQ10 START domain-containing protein n=1 Tax=Planotetraspora kaengkrachanensis TaxID=575193 RepID=A0A8J3M5I4_9ACTN|nr:SRPBCC family protein [Planotetraspora kaengkrachanensis]GIG79626.1 hypothetical protein Pka01_27530 [Planotetraspora kaengkrachanensis]
MSGTHDSMPDRLAHVLGWASLTLGAMQLAAPRAVARISGVDDSPAARVAIPLAGSRQLLHAATLLHGRDHAPGLWSRLAGDAVDVTSLTGALVGRTGTRRRRIAAVTAGVIAVTAVDAYAALRIRRARGRAADTAERELRAAITVKRPREEVYRFWHDFENFPRFMAHVDSVRMSDGQTHWRVRGPATKAVEWDAEIIDDRPGELIAWRSTGGSLVPNSGVVRFTDAPGGRGTEVRVQLCYHMPAGRLGGALAKLTGEHPEQQVRDDLRRFKQVMETGEVVRSEGSPEGTRALRQAFQRRAQPVA